MSFPTRKPGRTPELELAPGRRRQSPLPLVRAALVQHRAAVSAVPGALFSE